MVTIKDIARLSGVSVSTVSRVLNNHPDVSQDARTKVMAVVDEYNYIPNNSARDLGKSNSDNIGLIVRGFSNPFYTKIIQEIEQKIDAAGYTMVMQQIGVSEDEIRAAAMMEKDKRLQAVILLGGKMDYTPDQVTCIGVPFVCCSYSNAYGNLDSASYSSVSIDDSQAAYTAVKKLYEEGHRRIAVLLSRPDDGSISQIRYEGYVQALKDLGLELDSNLIISAGSYNIADAYEKTKTWLQDAVDCTAIFSIADNMAIGAMKAISEKGYSVPDDYSIVAIDGIELSEYMVPTLSTFCQPMIELGARSVEILKNIIEGTGEHKQETLPTIFREGESIAHKG